MASQTSSSDSEDDEERRKLSLALDPDFLKSTTAQFNGNSNGKLDHVSSHSSTLESAPVSKRSKLFDKSDECNEFAKPYSLDVTPACQKFIAKQLAKSLEGTLKEVSTSIQTSSNAVDTGIKLFASSQCRVTEEDLQNNRVSQPKPTKRKRKKKRSGKDKDSSDSSSDSENEKLKSVAVTADWVLNSI